MGCITSKQSEVMCCSELLTMTEGMNTKWTLSITPFGIVDISQSNGYCMTSLLPSWEAGTIHFDLIDVNFNSDDIRSIRFRLSEILVPLIRLCGMSIRATIVQIDYGNSMSNMYALSCMNTIWVIDTEGWHPNVSGGLKRLLRLSLYTDLSTKSDDTSCNILV